MKLKYIFFIIIIILSFFIISLIFLGVLNTSKESFTNLIVDTYFLKTIFFTAQTSLIATFLAFLTGVPSGYYLARDNRFIAKILDIILDLPVVIPPLVVGVLLINLFNLPAVKKFYTFIFTPSGAIIAQYIIAVPLTIKTSKSAFEIVSPVYEKIAMTLGANTFRAFYDTTFRIAMPGILSGTVLTLLRCAGEFGATLMVGGGIPGKTENIPVNIYINMSAGDFDKAMATSILFIFFIFFALFCVKILIIKNRVKDG